MAEKEFPPSARRLGKLRREGKVVKSQWVAHSASFIAVAACLGGTLPWVRGGSLIQWLNCEGWAPEQALSGALFLGFRVIALALSAAALSAVLLELAQSRGLFLPSLLLQGFKRYRPGAYLSKVQHGFFDGCAGVLRVAGLLLVVVPVFCALEAQGTLLFGLEGEQRSILLGIAVRDLVWRIEGLLVLLAAVSYGLARWKFFREHRMSLHDLRDEFKEGEGDPHLKAARKHEHAALVMADLERRVRRSKVIVVRRAPRQ